jgi:MFS family permease
VSARRAQVFLLYGATLANFLAQGIYFAAIPLYVSQELGGSRAAVGLSVGAFSLSAVLFRPSIGRGMDHRGRKPFLLGGLTLLACTGPAFLLVHAVIGVVLIRLVQGLAGGAFYTTAAAVATDLAPPEERASAIAKFSLFLYAGFAAGPALGEYLIRTSGYTATWLTAGALALAGAALVSRLAETGTAVMAQRAEVARPRRRFLHPAAVTPGAVLACSAVGYVSITAFSPLYARAIGMSSSGALYTVFAVTIIGVRLASLRLIDERAHTAVALPGLALGAAGLGTLALLPYPATAFVGVAAFGAGFALIFPSLMAFTVDRVPEHERGEVLGSFTAFMDVGAGLGGYLVGFVADHLGFRWGYATPALLCIGGFLLLAGLSPRPTRTSARRVRSRRTPTEQPSG